MDVEQTTAVETEAPATEDSAEPSGQEQVVDETSPAEAPEVAGEGQEAEAAAEETPGEPVIPSALAERAKGMGFDEDFVKTFKDPAQLEAVLTAQDRRMMDFFAAQQQPPQPEQQAQPPAQRQPPPAAVQQQLPAEAAEDFKWSADYTSIGDDLEKDVKGLHEFHSKRSQAVMAELQRANQRMQVLEENLRRRDLQVEIDWFKSQVAGMGDEWKGVIGTGEEPPDSPLARAHFDLWKAYAQMKQVAQATGQAVSKKDLLERARAVRFGDRLKAAARNELKAKIVKRAGQILPRGTNREGTGKVPTKDETAKGIAADLKKFGYA